MAISKSVLTSIMLLTPEGRDAVDVLRGLPAPPESPEHLKLLDTRRKNADEWVFLINRDGFRQRVARHMWGERGRVLDNHEPEPILLQGVEATERHAKALEADGWLVERQSPWPFLAWLCPATLVIRDPDPYQDGKPLQ